MVQLRNTIFIACMLCIALGPSAARAADILPASQGFPLGPGDVLEVAVWGDEALRREVLIRPDGKMSFPLIGDVEVQGMSVDQVRASLEKRLSEFVPNAPVAVLLKQLGYPRVFVVGKVAKPGIYVMTSPTRIMHALSMAGGLTPFASQDNILILRDEGLGQKTFRFRYGEVEGGKNLDQNISLMPNDTIVVP
jgi:polysaccharide export outer membrane protein